MRGKEGSSSGQEEEVVGFWDSTDTYGCVCYHVVVSTFILAPCEEMLCAVPLLLCRGEQTNVLQRVGQRGHDAERPPMRTGGKGSGC